MAEFLTLPYESRWRFAAPRHTGNPRWCLVDITTRLARESASYVTGCGRRGRHALAHPDLSLAAPRARTCWRCLRTWARRDHQFPLDLTTLRDLRCLPTTTYTQGVL